MKGAITIIVILCIIVFYLLIQNDKLKKDIEELEIMASKPKDFSYQRKYSQDGEQEHNYDYINLKSSIDALSHKLEFISRDTRDTKKTSSTIKICVFFICGVMAYIFYKFYQYNNYFERIIDELSRAMNILF